MKKIKEYWVEIILAGTAAMEMLFLFYYNIFHLRDALDGDFAMVLRHVMEMGDRHTLFLKNWNYMTQGEMDESSLIALPVYMLTKNIWLGYAVAGVINVLLWAFVIWRLLTIAKVGHRYKLAAIILVFLPYKFGMVEYTNMMFFAAGYDVYKVLLPLLFLIVMLTDFTGRFRIPDICLTVLYFVLNLFVGIASRSYVLICGLFPILVCFVFCMILGVGREKHKRWILTSAATLLVTGAGMWIGGLGGVPASTYKMLELIDVFENIPVTLLDILKLLNTLSPNAESPATLRGIAALLRLFLVGMILGFGLLSTGRVLGLQLYRKVRKEGRDAFPDGSYAGEAVQSSLISIFLWNYLIVLLTVSTPRYYLVGIIPLMLLAAMNLESFMKKDEKKVLTDLLPGAFGLVMAFLCLFSAFMAETEYFHEEDKNHRVMDRVLSFMEEHDVGTAFDLRWDDDSDTQDKHLAERLRVLDRSKVFESYFPDENFVTNRIFYQTETDRSEFTDKNILIAPEEAFERCPDYIRNSYEKAAEAEDYCIWLSDTNPLDGPVGLPDTERSVDLPSSRWYQWEGKLDGAGFLHTDAAGAVLVSPSFPSDGRSYRMICRYEAASEDTKAFLDLYRDEEKIGSYPLEPGKTETEIDIPSGEGMYRYEIRKEDDSPLVIKGAEFAVR